MIEDLDPRELKTLKLMSLGYNNTHIASTLVVGIKSVEHYINNIFSKLELTNTQIFDKRVKAVCIYLDSMQLKMILDIDDYES